MDRKELTLHIIFDLVNEDSKPLRRNIYPNEIISRHHFPWDQIMQDLSDLDANGFIRMRLQPMASITMTEEGYTAASGLRAVTAA